MMDKFEIQALKLKLNEQRSAYHTHMYMIDDMMDEILMIDNPEAMREIAMFVKEILIKMEEI